MIEPWLGLMDLLKIRQTPPLAKWILVNLPRRKLVKKSTLKWMQRFLKVLMLMI
jgi:hypothetical protein